MASAAPITSPSERLEIILRQLRTTQSQLRDGDAIAKMPEEQRRAAGGTAHDLANLAGHTQCLLDDPTEDNDDTAITYWIEYQEILMNELNNIMILTPDTPYHAFALKPEPVDLSSTSTQLQKLQKMLEALVIIKAKTSGNDLQFRADFADLALPPLNIDWLALQRVIINLVQNAIKFTEHGSIDVSIRAIPNADNQGACINISIRDTGPGIKTGTLEKPEPSAALAARGGAGWGTHYCRAIINAMGGTLTYRANDAESGTIFEFGINATYAPRTGAAQAYARAATTWKETSTTYPPASDLIAISQPADADNINGSTISNANQIQEPDNAATGRCCSIM